MELKHLRIRTASDLRNIERMLPPSSRFSVELKPLIARVLRNQEL